MRIAIVTFLVLAITVLHFTTSIHRPSLHQIYQRSYYIPIVLAGYWFEILGGLATASSLAILFVIHIWRDWSHHPDYTVAQVRQTLIDGAHDIGTPGWDEYTGWGRIDAQRAISGTGVPWLFYVPYVVQCTSCEWLWPPGP